ncbi:MAG: hypothetical protein COT74_09365 [Bdellovibrionales bacterium CG10_big_fil_rev_8_21_14_0_10_45_34]|nr:MAG: hypothetical protein COT74_09365 [Bdellovibrionales bacterium CG10_big_fil_rev_8_21_14_0_10_45_34]
MSSIDRHKILSLFPVAHSIVRNLADSGFEAYFVGGCVRDALLGRKIKDVDIVTNAQPDEVEKVFSDTRPVGKAFGIILVVEEGESFEVATFRKESGYKDFRRPSVVEYGSLEEDAARRDFSMNALYFDPFTDTLVDPIGGKRDLEKKIIRAIGTSEERFNEDRLRLLRAVRFVSQLGFEIESETLKAIEHLSLREQGEVFKGVSQERMTEEMKKLLLGHDVMKAVQLVQRLGWVAEIFQAAGLQSPKNNFSDASSAKNLNRLEESSVIKPNDSELSPGTKPTRSSNELGIAKSNLVVSDLGLGAKVSDEVFKAYCARQRFRDVESLAFWCLFEFLGFQFDKSHLGKLRLSLQTQKEIIEMRQWYAQVFNGDVPRLGWFREITFQESFVIFSQWLTIVADALESVHTSSFDDSSATKGRQVNSECDSTQRWEDIFVTLEAWQGKLKLANAENEKQNLRRRSNKRSGEQGADGTAAKQKNNETVFEQGVGQRGDEHRSGLQTGELDSSFYAPEPLVRGNDLMALGLKGSKLGETLHEIWMLQLEGKILTKEAALQFAISP